MSSSWASKVSQNNAASPPESVTKKPRMKYVPPPSNGGSWARPQRSGGHNNWDELAAEKDAQLKTTRKGMRMGAAQDAKVDMSGNDKADIMAKKTNYDIWTRDDVKGCHSWARGESCRIPNKRLAKGGRLHKLINIICNNCEEVHTVLMSNKIFQNAESDPTQPSGLELRRQFVAPLAKRVLNKVEEEEREAEYEDSDGSDEMAM